MLAIRRPGWARILLALGLYVVLTTAAAFVLLLVLEPDRLAAPAGETSHLPPPAPTTLAWLLLGQAGAGILVVLLMTALVDRRPLSETLITPGSEARWSGGAWGLVLGIILGSVVVLFIAATGGRRLHPYLMPGTTWEAGALLASTILASAAAEEWFLRGYVFTNLRDTNGAGRTILLTALLFSAMHAANPGGSFLSWINIILVGVVLAELREITGGLFVPLGLHAGWNLTLGLLFGVQVSGISLPSVLRVSMEDLPPALGGGAFGPEASLVVTVLFGGVAVLLSRRLGTSVPGLGS